MWVIVVAAGQATRFGGSEAVRAAGRAPGPRLVAGRGPVGGDGVVVVVPPGAEGRPEPGAERTVAGGATRSASVRAGLAAVPDDATVVLVHDAARPLASAELFARVVDAVRHGADAAVPVVPVADTLRRRARWGGRPGRARGRADPPGLPRPPPSAPPTPPVPRPPTTPPWSRQQGGTVVLVDGEPSNRKITDPADLGAAEGMLQRCT